MSKVSFALQCLVYLSFNDYCSQTTNLRIGYSRIKPWNCCYTWISVPFSSITTPLNAPQSPKVLDGPRKTDGSTRKRTRNVKTDLACKGRERQNNPKDLEIKYEDCKVCGRSFKKGRGLNIHMSVTNCRAIWERRNRNKDKSEEGTTPESHHSGCTIEQIAPSQNPDEIMKTVT